MNSENPKHFSRLIANIGRLQSTRLDQFTEKIGLYRGQSILLLVLSEGDGITHSELAQFLEISPAATTKVIKRLEELNYLERRADPSDDRISRVFLREDGWAVIHRIRAVFKQIDNAIIKGLSIEEQEVLINLLSRVYENLQSTSIDP